MTEHELLNVLANVKLLRPLTYPALRRLAALGRILKVKQDFIIIGPEIGSINAYVVLEGSIAVVMPWGPVLAYLGPGELFGEMALIAGIERTAYCKAAIDSVVFEIPFNCFHADMLPNPVVRAAIENLSFARHEVQQAIRQGGPPPELTPPEEPAPVAEAPAQADASPSEVSAAAVLPKPEAPKPPPVYATA
jgi:signal-transduction protein with cAMP-binding, CBS, and nucleotidyltransferase domain